MNKPPSCIGCPYYDRPYVEGDGYVGAELIVIGQSPGDREKAEGRPFVGPSGQVLGRALQKADISRHHSYVTNVVKCYVPAGVPVEAAAVAKCAPLLKAEFAQLPNAKTVLAVGAEAFNALSGKELKLVHNRKSAEKNPRSWLRGNPFRLGERTLIGTLHPSFVMRSGFMNAPTFEHDVERASLFAHRILAITEPVQNDNPTDAQVNEYIDILISMGVGGIDIETPEAPPDEDEADAVTKVDVQQIGLAAPISKSPFGIRVGESISVKPHQFHLLERLFQHRVRLWAYGAGFDFMHLGKIFDLSHIEIADAMIAFYLLWSDLMSFDLATAQTYYSEVPYYKNWRKLNPTLYDTLGNCYDTFTALEIGEKCLEEMRKKPLNMEPLFWSLMPVIKAVEPWKTVGCNYDIEGGMRVYLQLTKVLEGYDSWWKANMPGDWSSPQQLVQLFEAMKIRVPKKKRPNGEFTPCVDDDALEKMENDGHQVASLIRTMRSLRKASDFVGLADKDGRVRTRAKIHGQAGGRIQLVDQALQTVPEELAGTSPRSLFIPDHPDDLILQVDFSQAEFFIYAWYTQDPELLAIHESGEYCYGFFHEEIFHEPFFEEGKPRKKRFARKDIAPWKLLVTKSYPLGITYGREALPSEYKWLLDWYHKKFTRVRPFHNNLIYQATNQGFLQTCFGRMRRFPNARGQRNKILAFPGQSTLPDVLVRNAILPLTERLSRDLGERSRLLFTVHDSAICNIHGAARSLTKAHDAIDYVTEVVQQPIPEMGGFRLYAEAKIGPSWGEGHLKHRLDKWWESSHVTTV